MVRHWHRLPREVVDALPLETFRILRHGETLLAWREEAGKHTLEILKVS